MEFNNKRSVFTSNETDRELLGMHNLPLEVPLTDARNIYDRAMKRAVENKENFQIDSAVWSSQQLRIDFERRAEQLRGIIAVVTPHVPELVSEANDVEARLDEWSRKYS